MRSVMMSLVLINITQHKRLHANYNANVYIGSNWAASEKHEMNYELNTSRLLLFRFALSGRLHLGSYM